MERIRIFYPALPDGSAQAALGGQEVPTIRVFHGSGERGTVLGRGDLVLRTRPVLLGYITKLFSNNTVVVAPVSFDHRPEVVVPAGDLVDAPRGERQFFEQPPAGGRC